MIVTEIFECSFDKGLTKSVTKKFFQEKKINPVKWAIVCVSKNSYKILASFEKKF